MKYLFHYYYRKSKQLAGQKHPGQISQFRTLKNLRVINKGHLIKVFLCPFQVFRWK